MSIEISFADRTALVVGGGGGGIGSAVCHRLADAGADIIALSAVAADLVTTREEVEARGQRCLDAVVDVTRLDELRDAIETTSAAADSGVDLVVRAARGSRCGVVVWRCDGGTHRSWTIALPHIGFGSGRARSGGDGGAVPKAR